LRSIRAAEGAKKGRGVGISGRGGGIVYAQVEDRAFAAESFLKKNNKKQKGRLVKAAGTLKKTIGQEEKKESGLDQEVGGRARGHLIGAGDGSPSIRSTHEFKVERMVNGEKK